jgi:SAM-dependent methyltransferase
VEHCKRDYKKSAYELSSYGCTLEFLRRNFERVQSSEYYPGKGLGTLVEGIDNQDVQKLTYSDSSFDIITSNQVFEHVPDDIRGFSECFRVLRTGGALVFTVPWYDTKETTRKASIVNGEVVFDGEPEYHDSRIDGANSSPVFHHHSKNDICDRVKSVGFSKVFLREVRISKYQGSSQLVLYAIK